MALGVLLFCGTSAYAQEPQRQCGPLTEIVKQLHDLYHEEPVSAGATSSAAVMLFRSKGGKTWTLVAALKPQDKLIGCIMASGTHWGARKAVP